MNKVDIDKTSNFMLFLIRLVLAFTFIMIMASLFQFYGFIFAGGIIVVFFVVGRYMSLRKMLKEQRLFMKKKDKVQTISMDVGRWGDFVYIYIFGVYFAADYERATDVRNMIKDVTYAIDSVRSDGVLPKGKFFSEVTADMVRSMGVDSEFIEWKCETEILNDILFLRKLGCSSEQTMGDEWVNGIATIAKNEGRTVFHKTYIKRVLLKVERVAEALQVDSIKAGGFSNGN